MYSDFPRFLKLRSALQNIHLICKISLSPLNNHNVESVYNKNNRNADIWVWWERPTRSVPSMLFNFNEI